MIKSKISVLFVTLVLAMTFAVSDALPQNTAGNSNGSQLLLNGQPFDVNHFPDVGRGVLTLVKEDRQSGKAPRVTFYAYIKRAGKIIDAHSYAHNHPLEKVEIAELLKSAKAGDVLIIDPANPADKVGRSIITVVHKPVLPVFQWFYVQNKNDKDC